MAFKIRNADDGQSVSRTEGSNQGIVNKLTRDEENVNDTELCNKRKIANDKLTGSALTESGHAMSQLCEALCYKPIGSGFDFVCCQWNFS